MTEREQLTEIQKEIILSKMEDKSEQKKARAIRDIGRMNFTDHSDFMEYVRETTGEAFANNKVKETTPEELDAAFGNMFGKHPKSADDDKTIEDAFKNFKL